MKCIIVVTLATDRKTGEIDPAAPFMVHPEEPSRNGLYYDEPGVIAQFFPGERSGRFEAEWTDEGWIFGKRVADA